MRRRRRRRRRSKFQENRTCCTRSVFARSVCVRARVCEGERERERAKLGNLKLARTHLLQSIRAQETPVRIAAQVSLRSPLELALESAEARASRLTCKLALSAHVRATHCPPSVAAAPVSWPVSVVVLVRDNIRPT